MQPLAEMRAIAPCQDMFRFNAQVMGFGTGGWPLCSNVCLVSLAVLISCPVLDWLFWNVLDTFQYWKLSHWRMGFLRMDQILNSFGDIVVNACDSLRLHEECDLLSLRIDKASRFGVLDRKRVRAFLVNCLNLDWFIFGEVTEMTLKCFVSFVQSWPCYRCCSVAGHAMAAMEWGLWGPSATVLL